MIPKIIHYCWFGNKMPIDIQACIFSWKIHLKEYQFKCWSEANFDINSVLFVKEAYENKKFAFVADYVRCFALYTEGGIYLDTDVVVLKKFDSLLDNGVFTTMERFGDPNNKYYNLLLDSDRRNKDHSVYIPYLSLLSAIIGCEQGHGYMRKMLDIYNNRSFILPDGTMNNKVIITMIMANVAEEYGYRYVDELQRLEERITIYPSEILACKRSMMTKKTVAVHCGYGSWLKNKSLKGKLANFFKVIYVLLKGISWRFLY